MPLTPPNSQILEAIAGLDRRVQKLAAVVQKVEVSLAKRIPPEQLAETHLNVHLLKQESVTAANERARIEVRMAALEAWRAAQDRNAAGVAVKWGVAKPIALGALGLVFTALGVIIKTWLG